jgi:hypothetical protein
MNGSFLHLFVYQKIGALAFPPPVLASEAIHFEIVRVELPHAFVIELNPPALGLFDVAEIMAKLCRPVMQDNSFKQKLIVFSRTSALLLIESVGIDIQIVGELPP